MKSGFKIGALFLLAFITFLMAFSREAKAFKCSCIAEPYSKEYQHYSQHFWGSKRQWTCVYNCRVYGHGEMQIVGGHREWYLGKDDGREGVCDGIGFKNQYNNYVMDFIWIPQEPQRFDPLHSTAKNLKTWAEEACR